MSEWNVTLLEQKWTHSFEEDTAEESIYRPEGFALAPARGRAQFSLKAHGELLRTPIGRDDVRLQEKGTWKLSGDHLLLETADGALHQYHLKEVTSEKLVLKK